MPEKYLIYAAEMLDCEVADLPVLLVAKLNHINALIKKCKDRNPGETLSLRSRQIVATVVASKSWD